MKEIYRYIVLITVIILSFFIRFFISYKASKVKGIEYFKKKLKQFIIIIICVIIITTIYDFIPKHETNIDINIINKNNIKAEIYINDNLYNIYENKNILDINIRSGFIAVKTENSNKIVYYKINKSIFSFNKKININLRNKKIKINSYFVDINSAFPENHVNYDSMIELLLKNW